jgi:Domain of unknown function (DUF4328)
MQCPRCGLYNPDSALRCDCGHDFKTGTIQPSYLEQAVIEPKSIPTFVSGHSLAQWVLIFILLGMLMHLIAIGSDYSQIQFILKVKAGDTISPGTANANDRRQQTIGSLQLLVLLPTYLLCLLWIHRVHRNLLALGARRLRFTPGWAVGWWFVPIMNWFRPYQVMKEIWKASDPEVKLSDSSSWQTATTPRVMPWWWALFLVSHYLGSQLFGKLLSPSTQSGAALLDDLLLTSWAMLALEVLNLAVSVCAITLISGIDKHQEEKSQRLGLR